jgi:hypothetical protein
MQDKQLHLAQVPMLELEREKAQACAVSSGTRRCSRAVNEPRLSRIFIAQLLLPNPWDSLRMGRGFRMLAWLPGSTGASQ